MRFRRYVYTTLAAVAGTSFVSALWMFYQYHGFRPDRPYPELGRIYRSNNHGSFAYLTASESTGLDLLLAGFMLAILFAGIVRAVSGDDPRDLSRSPSKDEKIAMAVAAICYLIFIVFEGPSIAEFAVSHGIVLAW